MFGIIRKDCGKQKKLRWRRKEFETKRLIKLIRKKFT